MHLIVLDHHLALAAKRPTATQHARIAGGYDHTLVIQADGSLWAWGDNYYGQLGLGNTTDQTSPQRVGTDANWVAVATGKYYSLALKADGTLWAWGYNAQGQLGLGLGDTTHRNSPVQVGPDANILGLKTGLRISELLS